MKLKVVFYWFHNLRHWLAQAGVSSHDLRGCPYCDLLTLVPWIYPAVSSRWSCLHRFLVWEPFTSTAPTLQLVCSLERGVFSFISNRCDWKNQVPAQTYFVCTVLTFFNLLFNKLGVILGFIHLRKSAPFLCFTTRPPLDILPKYVLIWTWTLYWKLCTSSVFIPLCF